MPPRIGTLWASHSQKNDHRQCPLLRAGGERPRPDGAADEGDELAPSRAFNPWTDPGRE
jgi:hypothetical protein